MNLLNKIQNKKLAYLHTQIIYNVWVLKFTDIDFLANINFKR